MRRRRRSFQPFIATCAVAAVVAALAGTSALDHRGGGSDDLSFTASAKDIGLTGSKSRIINGKPVDAVTMKTRYPGVVPLLDTRFGTKPIDQFFCAGTLVSPTLVVTAAHCADATTLTSVRVGIGMTTLTATTPVPVTVKTITKHPSWISSNYEAGNDIAVLTLTKATTAAATPIVGAGEDLIWGNGAGVTAAPDRGPWLVGWGNTTSGAGDGTYPETPNDTNIQLLPDAACSAPGQWGSQISTAVALCGGGHTTDDPVGTSACDGDSGGPVLAAANGSWRVVGIVSYGELGCDPTMSSVFTKVAAMRTWLTGLGVPAGTGSVTTTLPVPSVTGRGEITPPGPALTLEQPADGQQVSGLTGSISFDWKPRTDQRADSFVVRRAGVEVLRKAAESSWGAYLTTSDLPAGTYQWCVTSVDDVNGAPAGEFCRTFVRVAAHQAGMTSVRLRGRAGSYKGSLVSTEPVVRVSVKLMAGRTVLAKWSRNVRTRGSGRATTFAFTSRPPKLRRTPRTVTAQVTVSGGGTTKTFRNVLR